jgi:hypothetical protein
MGREAHHSPPYSVEVKNKRFSSKGKGKFTPVL